MNKATKMFGKYQLKPEIMQSLEEMKNLKSSPIQEKALPILMTSRKNLVGQAENNFARIITYTIPILENIDYDSLSVQAIVLTSSKDQTTLLEKEIFNVGKYTDVRTVGVHLDGSYDDQVRSLICDKPQIVVGSAERILELNKNGELELDEVTYCVFDEADQFLSSDEVETINDLLSQLKEEKQLILLTKTITDEVQVLIDDCFQQYEQVKGEVSIQQTQEAVSDIEENYYLVKENYFLEALTRIAETEKSMRGIVYCSKRNDIRKVASGLKKRGLKIEVLGVELSGRHRAQTLKRFQERDRDLLICSDATVKGLTIENITHVFHYGLPQNIEMYIKRLISGSKSLSIVNTEGLVALKKLEGILKRTIQRKTLPNAESLKKSFVANELQTVERIVKDIREKGDSLNLGEQYQTFQEKVKMLDQEELTKLVYVWRFSQMTKHFDTHADLEDDPNRQTVKKIKPQFKPNHFKRKRPGFDKNKQKPKKRSF